MFITNTQTSIGYVNIMTKIAIYKNFGKQLYVTETKKTDKLVYFLYIYSLAIIDI